MRHRVFTASVLPALTSALVLLLSPARSAPPPAAPPPAGATGTGTHHSRHYGHYGHYRHWGHYYGHYRHDGLTDSALGSSVPSVGAEESFVKDGRRYYWHYRSNGHRYYSSHPDAGTAAGLDLGPGEDLEAPLSREGRAARAARIHQDEARLAAIEKRLARQRHQRRLQEKALLPKIKSSSARH